jgi:serine/threonine protein kinase
VSAADDSWVFSESIPDHYSSGDLIDDRFEVRVLVGEGQTGAVYHCLDKVIGRDIALKILRLKNDPELYERFCREGELTAALSHPNIVTIHGTGSFEGGYYIVYEFISGRALEHSNYLARPLSDRLVIFHQVVEAMAYAHKQGIVHRDLKATNILLDEDGQPHIADFGLAWAPGLETLTKTGALLGTPRYMAPEALEESKTVGPASDVWSLGVFLYWTLTASYPFVCEQLGPLIAEIIESQPAEPRATEPGIPDFLNAICMSCLKKDKGRRYPNAMELMRALDCFESKRAYSFNKLWLLIPMIILSLALVFSMGSRESKVRAAFEQYKQGQMRAGELEQELAPAAVKNIDPLLISEIYWALARDYYSRPQRDLPKVMSCIEKAEFLVNESLTERNLLLARIYSDLGQHKESAVHYGLVYKASPKLELVILQLKQHLRARQIGLAMTLARELKQQGKMSTAESARLFVRTLIELGEPERALKLARRFEKQDSSISLMLLTAQVQSVLEQDSRASLKRLIKAAPLNLEIVLALARAHLQFGDLVLSKRVLSDALKRSMEKPALERALSFLAIVQSRDPDVSEALIIDENWKSPALAYLHRRIHRESAFVKRSLDPRIHYKAKVILDRRTARIRFDQELIRALSGQPVAPLKFDRAMTRGFDGSKAEKLFKNYLFLRRNRNTVRQTEKLLDELLGEHPEYWPAVFSKGLHNLARSPALGLKQCMMACSLEPSLSSLLVAHFQVAWGPGAFLKNSSKIDYQSLIKLCPETADGRLWRAVISTIAIEKLGRHQLIEKTRAELDDILKKNPAEVIARLFRAFLFIRQDQLELAARDLKLAAEDQSEYALLFFYQALLLAAQKKSVFRILKLLNKIPKFGYPFWRRTGWSLEAYREFQAYRESDDLLKLLGG